MSEHIQIDPVFHEAIEMYVKIRGPATTEDACAKIVQLVDVTFGEELCEVIDSLHPDNRRWSATEPTGPHDHGQSIGAIAVLRGTVADRGYTCGPEHHMRDCKEGELTVYTIDRRYLEGSVVTLPLEYTHDMFGTTASKTVRDVTVHAYWPPLVEMGYFEQTAEHKLKHTTVWRKPTPEQKEEVPAS